MVNISLMHWSRFSFLKNKGGGLQAVSLYPATFYNLGENANAYYNWTPKKDRKCIVILFHFPSFFLFRRREMMMNSLQKNSNFKYVFPPRRLTSSIKQLYNACRLVTLLVSFLDTCARIVQRRVRSLCFTFSVGCSSEYTYNGITSTR